MPGEIESKIEGLKELEINLDKVFNGLDDNVIGDGFQAAGRRMAILMKRKVNKKTGNLQKGIVAKKFRTRPRSKIERQFMNYSFVGINYRYAPHAHLVEFGHMALNGKFVKPNQFYRPVVDEFRLNGTIETEVSKAVEKALDKALKIK